METDGAKQCFKLILDAGLKIAVFISNRHKAIAKWNRDFQKGTLHLYDIWHVCKSIQRDILKASKEKGCEILKDWSKAIKNHLYSCATSTMQGFGVLIVAKRTSIVRHVSNKHSNHPNPLYKKCEHGDQEPRDWIDTSDKYM